MKNRRARIVNQMPVAAVQAAALNHSDLAMRRLCLFLLDHYASDASWSTFRRALRDPVASVREIAVHGLSCERCRSESLCVADVVTDLIDILASDPSAEVRHKTVILLARFVGRDARVGEAIARASIEDPDSAIRHVARGIVEPGQPQGPVLRRKRALRAVRRERRWHSDLGA